MLSLTLIIGGLGLVLFILGCFKADLVMWLIDTIIWLVWIYVAWNYASSLVLTGNTYFPTALALIGVGLLLFCIYKDFSIILVLLKTRKKPLSSSDAYDGDVQQGYKEEYERSRRRY